MKRVVALVLTAMMLTGMLTGCGSKDNTPAANAGNTEATTAPTVEATVAATEGATEDKEPVSLRFSWWGGDERLAATLAVIDQFETLYPYITIEAEYGSSDGYHDKLSTQLAAGTAPDIIQIDPETMPTFVAADAGAFVDYNEYGFDFSNFDESYYKQQINGNYDGKQFGIPTGIAGPAMLINQDLATAIGIDFTQDYSWEDLITWGKKVREYDDSLYLICTNKEYITNMIVFNYAKQLTGKSIIDIDTKTVNLTEAQLNEIYTYIQSLYDNEVIAPASYMAAYSGDSLQSDPNWITGKYVSAFTYISTAEVLTAANTTANYTIGNLPLLSTALNAGWSANCPQIIAVSNLSENKEEAVMFIDYFFNNETSMLTLASTRSVPPTAKAREICEQNGLLSNLLVESANIASTLGGVKNDRYSSSQEAKQILVDEVEAVGYAATSPESAATDTLSLLQNYLSNVE